MGLSIVSWVGETLHNPFLDWLMPKITFLGDNGYVWIGICLILLCFSKTRKWGLVGFTALAFMLISVEVIKALVQRPRPFTHLPEFTLLIPPLSSFSFPSGHTTSSFAAASVFFRMDRRWGSCALVLAALIGFSRLYLLVHYPGDILAGALLGIGCAYGAYHLWRKRLSLS